MMAHAEKLEFEQAAELRNQVAALSNVLHQQSVDNVCGPRCGHSGRQGARRQSLREFGHGAWWTAPG